MDNRGTYIHKHQPSNEYFSTTQSFTNPDESGRTTVHITDRDDYRNYGVREVVHQPPSMATNQVVKPNQSNIEFLSSINDPRLNTASIKLALLLRQFRSTKLALP
jgi:hypothetical protein